MDASSPIVHQQIVRLSHVLNSKPSLPGKVLEVLQKEFTIIEPSTDLEKYNNDYASSHKDSPRHAIASVKAKRSIGGDRSQCARELIGLLDLEAITPENALDIMATLRSWRSPEIEGFKTKAKGKWPQFTRFA